jgi:NADPH2:quinone reductase
LIGFTSQWAHSFGCTVIGTAGTPEGEELVLQNGATFVVNHREPNYTQQIMTYTKGKGVDVILEMVANQNLSKDLSMLAFRGRVVVIGSRGSVEINPRDTMSKRSTIMGLLLFNYTPEEKNELDEAHQKALRQGILKPSIGPIYKLVDSPQAHIEVIDRASAAQGKIIIHPWD